MMLLCKVCGKPIFTHLLKTGQSYEGYYDGETKKYVAFCSPEHEAEFKGKI
jgi:hypothetical protein